MPTLALSSPLVRNADYTSMWKVTHWKSVNPTAFMRTNEERLWSWGMGEPNRLSAL
jgi:hypothetical protein